VMRAGGANLRPLEFNVSFAVAAAGIRHIALAGHTQCGMIDLASKQDEFIQGLVDAGWDRSAAEAHFQGFAPFFEVGNEADFVIEQARQLRLRYPSVQVAPLIYRVEDNRLYQVREQ
ncbi:MAG TPA: carbonic anhydrase, partial [Longimicrobiaceae bacterium]|nr:carbonic anhydrase [Longimicrobiaceae bacterium]